MLVEDWQIPATEAFDSPGGSRFEHGLSRPRQGLGPLLPLSCPTCKEKRLQELKAMPYEDYLASEEWQRQRQWHLTVAGHRCQVCNSDERLETHHRTYERKGNEAFGDLTVLCHCCHAKFHDKEQPDAQGTEAPPAPRRDPKTELCDYIEHRRHSYNNERWEEMEHEAGIEGKDRTWTQLQALADIVAKQDAADGEGPEELFLEAWERWRAGPKDRTVPMGLAWGDEVRGWLAHGISIQRLIAWVNSTMKKEHVRIENKWSYLAAIVNRVVESEAS